MQDLLVVNDKKDHLNGHDVMHNKARCIVAHR